MAVTVALCAMRHTSFWTPRDVRERRDPPAEGEGAAGMSAAVGGCRVASLEVYTSAGPASSNLELVVLTIETVW